MSRIVHLTPPRIDSEHIKEKITCIRGHRERIFNVSAEVHNHKHIFHNYGQGGAGWTFLFGCVEKSLQQFDDASLSNKPIAGIGAGCYGLATALSLAHKGHTVTIIAEDTENIPSQKAAGFFFPRPHKTSTPAESAQFYACGKASYLAYQRIIKGEHPFVQHGPKMMPAYFSLGNDPGFTPYINEGLMKAPEQVQIDFGTGAVHDALEYHTLFINPGIIMRELHAQVRKLGIPILQQTITSFDEVAEEIIFNCAGFGAKHLARDVRVIPIQGHLITLKDQAPEHERSYMLNVKVPQVSPRGTRDDLIYYAPKESGILGVTFIRGQSSLTANPHEFDLLLARCRKYFGN